MNYAQMINEHIKKKQEQGKFSLFSTSIAQKAYESADFDIYYNIIKDWDENCNLPIEIGEFLNKESESSDHLVAFSRVYIGELNNKDEINFNEINNIATNGLKNSGHINSSGVHQNLNSPSDCLSPLVGVEGWINLVGRYKGNNAIILYSLPREYVDNDCYFKDSSKAGMIYNFVGNQIYIKPEFLIGMIIKNKDIPDIFLTRDDMLNMGNTKTR